MVKIAVPDAPTTYLPWHDLEGPLHRVHGDPVRVVDRDDQAVEADEGERDAEDVVVQSEAAIVVWIRRRRELECRRRREAPAEGSARGEGHCCIVLSFFLARLRVKVVMAFSVFALGF